MNNVANVTKLFFLLCLCLLGITACGSNGGITTDEQESDSATESDSGVGGDADTDADTDTDTDTDADTGTDADGDTDICSDGESECQGDLVMHCDDGEWALWDDCPIQQMDCAMVRGAATCIAGPDGDADTDSDADADTDADGDADGDADVSCPYTCVAQGECAVFGGSFAPGYTCSAAVPICCDIGSDGVADVDSDTDADSDADGDADVGCTMETLTQCQTVYGDCILAVDTVSPTFQDEVMACTTAYQACLSDIGC